MPDVGREQWVQQAVDRYDDALASYAARILGDESRGRDVAQETFMRLWTADRMAVDPHLVEWLYTVCRRKALDVRRKESRMTAIDTTQLRITDNAQPPDESAERRDSVDQAMRAIELLSETQQEVIRLKFQAGLSYREIARITGHSESNVGFLISTGLKAVRERFAKSESKRNAESRRV